MGNFVPQKSDKFTFGLWTVGNPGADPFGGPVRTPVTPVERVHKLGELGAWGVNLHDNDLVPFGASAQQRDKIVSEFKQALTDSGVVVPMATTNLFSHPVFKDGAFTSNDPKVRAFALRKTVESIDLGAELGAKIYVFWGGREGTEVDASKDAVTALKRFREALDFLSEYAISQNYGMKFALEPKPNEPRGDIYLPTVGAMLGFISTLAHPEMVGVNPEYAHDTIAGLNFYHAVAQALEMGKLFHIDLNGQKPGRFDQDLRFGQEDYKSNFFLVKLLEDYKYDGPKHFDAHALRTSDPADVWEFAKGCMRSYLILKEKAQQFNADPEIQALLQEINAGDAASDAVLSAGFSTENLAALKSLDLDPEALALKPLPYEKLDQLTFELLLGVR
ncbi:xylose isomerase [Capsulimonas corticalis]|uniref:Xylose isomerase n=1 Tax=Capsulimonas corticalis TaxID=2219043 RepID=A0A402CP69_9BACT|nr:xylose isomerase [Capsulimonas corticalis]BDI33026.1 xylose isomerase [Capsulimonas corticalis]